ncbi:hypothetical protein VPHD239_0097 [Vibrio phage D239]
MKGCESSSLSSTAKFLITLLPQLCMGQYRNDHLI